MKAVRVVANAQLTFCGHSGVAALDDTLQQGTQPGDDGADDDRREYFDQVAQRTPPSRSSQPSSSVQTSRRSSEPRATLANIVRAVLTRRGRTARDVEVNSGGTGNEPDHR